MSTTQQLSSLPPRYFWRRVAAYLIDVIIIEIALILFFLILSLVTPWDLSIPLFQSTQCSQTASGPLIEKIEAQWPLEPGETRVNKLCHVSWLGSDGYNLLLSSVSSKDGATTYARSFSAAVDKNGNPVDPGTNGNALMSDVVLLIIPLVLAYGSADGRRTPGKRLLSLQVTTVEDNSPGFGAELKREVLKFLPLIVLSLLSVTSFFMTKAGNDDLDLVIERGIQTARDSNLLSADGATASLLLPPIVLILGLIWWIYPLIIWRGQTFYDRFSNCKVLKT
ncbi:MAG: RDD family protein [Rhizobium sp.]